MIQAGLDDKTPTSKLKILAVKAVGIIQILTEDYHCHIYIYIYTYIYICMSIFEIAMVAMIKEETNEINLKCHSCYQIDRVLFKKCKYLVLA